MMEPAGYGKRVCRSAKNRDITPKIFAVNTLFNIPKSDAVV
jgi:hypothetical protein